MNNVTDQVVDALRAAGADGLRLNELATRLGIESQSITLTIEQLTSEGLVMQKQELKDSKYILNSGMGDDTEQGSLSDMNGCPCFHCLKINRCGIRQPDSPVSCRSLEDWMLGSEPN